MNEPEYVENYGDQFSAVQMIFYIAKKSIFINFIKNIKNRIFYIFCIFLKKRAPSLLSAVAGPLVYIITIIITIVIVLQIMIVFTFFMALLFLFVWNQPN